MEKEIDIHWNEIGELQEAIISSLPDLIRSFNNQSPELIQHYAQVVTNNGLKTGGFSTIVSDIEQFLHDESSINIGLIYVQCAS